MANKQDTRIAIHLAHNYNSISKLSASMQPLWNIVQYATLFTKLTIHFIRFYTCFPLRGVAGTAAIGGLKIPHSHSNLRSFCWLHTKTGPSKVEAVNMPSGPWPTFGCLPMGAAGRTCLPTSTGILQTHGQLF